MKQIILFFAVLFCLNNLPAQSSLIDAKLHKIVQTDFGYISIVTCANDSILQKYLVDSSSYSHYARGIALNDKKGKLKWMHILEETGIVDFKVENDKIYVLNGNNQNSKSNSSGELYEAIFNLNGKLLSQKKLSLTKSEFPNASITAFYDDNGRIWSMVNWQSQSIAMIDEKEFMGSSNNNILVRCHKSGNKAETKCLVSGNELRLNTHDDFAKRVGFIFEGDSLKINGKSTGFGNEIRYLGFSTDGQLYMNKLLAAGKVEANHLKILKKGMLVSGEFQGNDSIVNSSSCKFRNVSLSTPKNRFREEPARNGFITELNDSLDINWIKKIESKCDIIIKSMGVYEKAIAVGLKYNDSIQIDKELITAEDKDWHEYTDDVLCFFDKTGKLNSYKHIPENTYLLAGFDAIKRKKKLQGSFLYNKKMFDLEYNKDQKKRFNSLLFLDKK